MEQDCCRICLSKTHSLERQDLFAEEVNNLSEFGQLYEEVLNIPIANEKITLKYICSSCSLQLKLFKQLKSKALETYLFLMELLNAIPSKDDNRVENQNEKEETNVLPTDNYTDSMSIIQFKDEYFVESEENSSITDFIDCQDNEQQENDIQNYNIEDATENNIVENDFTENDIAENDITENDISENHIAESDVIENYLVENAFAKNDYEMEYDMLRQIEEQQEDEKFPSFDEIIKKEENIRFDTSDEEEYEICYLDEDIIVENSEKELDQEEYNEKCLTDEEDINENNPISTKIEGTKSFRCPHCDETFTLQSQLKSHKNKMHSKTTKFKCPICNKALLSKETYEAHINVHNGLPAYRCNICEKAFNQKVHYNYHILNHNNERNIICDVCQKGFISSGDLKTHMRCHTDERPYKCDVCGKSFRAHTHMVNHRYSHFEKQFECPECFQKYTSPNTLRTHFKAVHNGEVPFECEFCEKRFKRKHHLQAHYKTHAKVIGNMSLIEE